MMTVFFIGGAILIAMICVSWYGWTTLPPDALIPIHFGAQYNNFVPKRIGLIMHPAGGTVAFLILVLVIHGGSANAGSSSTPPYLVIPLIMFVGLIVQIGAIRVARRRSGT